MNFSGVTTKQIRSFFKGLDSGRSPDDKVWVRIGKRIVIVEQVEGLIDKRQFVATLSVRDPGKAFGVYKNKTIYLSSLGDKYTLAHEGIHLLDDIGLINRLEQTVIEKAAGVERGASAGDRVEARAEYLTALLEAHEKTRNTVLGRIMQPAHTRCYRLLSGQSTKTAKLNSEAVTIMKRTVIKYQKIHNRLIRIVEVRNVASLSEIRKEFGEEAARA